MKHHHQALGELHALELATRHNLHVLRVGRAEAVFRLDAQAALVAGLEALQGQLEAGQQVAVAEGEGGRLRVEVAVHHLAAFQLDGEVQGHFLVRANTDVSHGNLRTAWN
ncbi:hypothetical protein D3C77_700860 [compost metagenome]